MDNYNFYKVDERGWGAYLDSVRMAGWTMLFGTGIVFLGAYLVEKGRGFTLVRGAIHALSVMPLAVPGLVLGLSYVFFFAGPGNPLHVIYGTMAILVISTIIHYYPVGHLIAVTALRQMDREFESVSASLKAPFYKTFSRVTVPVCVPALLDMSTFFFVSAMNTTSAVVFLFSATTMPASVSILNMNEAGATASAAGMSVLLFLTSGAVRGGHWLALRNIRRRTQAWRR